MNDTPETDGAEIIFSPLKGDAWVPASISRKLERERDEAREVLNKIANANHFDNIGNWARNEAKKALEAAK